VRTHPNPHPSVLLDPIQKLALSRQSLSRQTLSRQTLSRQTFSRLVCLPCPTPFPLDRRLGNNQGMGGGRGNRRSLPRKAP
jgi:hypothetical protein